MFQALASMLSSYSIFGKSGYNLLINQLQSKPFLNIDVDSYFWGYDDPLIALGNTLMPGWITFQRLGILDRVIIFCDKIRVFSSKELAQRHLTHKNKFLRLIKKCLPYNNFSYTTQRPSRDWNLESMTKISLI